eukprot:CAMPEP_0204887236 /NCGR_PEP_ID=MMETSP1349-20130617/17310_1 /ASSEMBLY_ACC=CAM_ASM_000710 /TAXON_ID=215587 /ORGANISM="Aplanochytrium stocchinoi, Strain GSBS06" /LENGTH=149 /DNA_ID=CAMNT_0052049863 /DNA_START=46 /DNA_END=491 /DNA_ORIENTATION=+
MVLTQTHTQTIYESEFQKYAEIWEAFVCEEAQIWNQFYEHWLHNRVSAKIPILAVRFEDLLQYRKSSLYRIARFVYDAEDLSDEISENIERICSVSQHESGVYKPRAISSESVNDTDDDESTDTKLSDIALGPLMRGKMGYLKSLKFFS